jgi:hypothetical protein
MYEIVLKYACPVSDIIAEDFLFMRIQLSEHFTYRKLLRFTLPSVIMMVCTSIYGVVDGVFVSNFVGSDAFAAVNLIMPFLMVLGAVGFMLGTGGSALVAYTLGAGSEKRANEIFSLLIYVLIGLGVDEDMILMDTTSASTHSNIKNAMQLLGGRNVTKVMIITSDYHLPRAIAIAEDNGLTAYGIGAPTKLGLRFWLKNHCREALAWCKYWAVKYTHLPLE